MAADLLLSARNLCKEFPVALRGKRVMFKAAREVSFDLHRGETLAIVGESGSGKTTTGRMVLRLIEPSSGKVMLNSVDLMSLKGAALRRALSNIQMVFQDPLGSFNPRQTLYSAIEEPLIVNRVPFKERRTRVREVAEQVELDLALLAKYPHQVSGGQRQRAAIARALVLGPQVIVADEPISALDASIQSQILNLLLKLQREEGLAYVFISHDLSVVRHIADTVAVMYAGEVVEYGPCAQVFESPKHPYTRLLLASVNNAGEPEESQTTFDGAPPGPGQSTSTCSFAPRCPLRNPKCDGAVRDVEVRNVRVKCCLAERDTDVGGSMP